MRFPHLLPLFCLFLALAAGGWVRFQELGAAPFWTDELNHHYTAIALAEGRGPLLPSGEPYTRGLSITRAIVVVRDAILDPEAAARLPSAAMGMLNLLLMAGIGWALGGPWAAVWATTLLAIYPEALAQARNVRFYTLQLNLGLVALAAGWFATLPRGPTGGGDDSPETVARGLLQGWSWLLLSVVALYLGYRLQPTTLTVVLALGAWIGGCAAADSNKLRASALRLSVPVQALVVGAVAFAALLVLGVAGPTLADLWSRATWTASWLQDFTTSPGYYLWLLYSTLPWVISLLPALGLLALGRAPRLTLYLATWFLVPLLIHSLLLPMKGNRFFLLPLPALFLIAGIGATVAAGALAGMARRMAEGLRMPYRDRLVPGVVAATGLWAIITMPAFSRFLDVLQVPAVSNDWQLAAEVLAERPDLSILPRGTTDPLMAHHFLDGSDFGVQLALLDYAVEPAPHHPRPRVAPQEGHDPFPRDYYTGLPLVLTPSQIRSAYGGHDAVIVALATLAPSMVDADLRTTLRREALDLCEERCRGFRLYLWTFGRTAEGPEPARGEPD